MEGSFYWFWEKAFSDYDLNAIIELAEQVPFEKEAHAGGEYNPDKRISNIKWLKDLSLKNIIIDRFHSANKLNFGYDVCYYLDDVQYTEYDAEVKGFYGWHIDCELFGNSPYQRKLSFVCMLSDDSDYEGGILELQEPGSLDIVQLNLKKNNAVVFPSFIKHRVTPITKGKRISLVSWMEGTRWK